MYDVIVEDSFEAICGLKRVVTVMVSMIRGVEGHQSQFKPFLVQFR